MKTVLSVLVGILIGSSISSQVKGQDHVPNEAPPVPEVVTFNVEDLPGLSLRDCIDVIAEYDIRHIDVPMATPWYGQTVFDERKIFLVNQSDTTGRRATAIHEVLHVTDRQSGNFLTPDRHLMIEAASRKLYLEMFASGK